MTPIERALKTGLEETLSDLRFLHARLYETGNDLADFVKDSHDVAQSYFVAACIHEANLNEEKKHEAAQNAVRAVVANASDAVHAPEDGRVPQADADAEHQEFMFRMMQMARENT